MFGKNKKEEVEINNTSNENQNESTNENNPPSENSNERSNSLTNVKYSIAYIGDEGVKKIKEVLKETYENIENLKFDKKFGEYFGDNKLSISVPQVNMTQFKIEYLYELEKELLTDHGILFEIKIKRFDSNGFIEIDFNLKEEKQETFLSLSMFRYSQLEFSLFQNEEISKIFNNSTKPNRLTINLILKIIGTNLAFTEYFPKLEKEKNSEKKLQDIKLKIEENGGRFYEPDNKGFNRIKGFEGLKEQLVKEIITPNSDLEAYNNYMNSVLNGLNGNKIEAFLFHGDPGNGKTNAARALAEELNLPMIYLNIENIASMFYGQNEKRLGNILEISEKIDGRVIIFFDEIDTFAANREGNGHEASKKMLGVILRYLDGLNENNDNIFIATTNLKDSLDKAFLSRMKSVIEFKNPTKNDLFQIGKEVAIQLTDEQLELFINSLFDTKNNPSIRDFTNSLKIFYKNLFIKFQENSNYKISNDEISSFFNS